MQANFCQVDQTCLSHLYLSSFHSFNIPLFDLRSSVQLLQWDSCSNGFAYKLVVLLGDDTKRLPCKLRDRTLLAVFCCKWDAILCFCPNPFSFLLLKEAPSHESYWVLDNPHSGFNSLYILYDSYQQLFNIADGRYSKYVWWNIQISIRHYWILFIGTLARHFLLWIFIIDIKQRLEKYNSIQNIRLYRQIENQMY